MRAGEERAGPQEDCSKAGVRSELPETSTWTVACSGRSLPPRLLQRVPHDAAATATATRGGRGGARGPRLAPAPGPRLRTSTARPAVRRGR